MYLVVLFNTLFRKMTVCEVSSGVSIVYSYEIGVSLYHQEKNYKKNNYMFIHR